MLTPLLITSGEPAGIGYDIILKLACTDDIFSQHNIIVLADINALQQRADSLNLMVTIKQVQDVNNINQLTDTENTLYVINIPCAETVEAGVLNVHNAQQVINQLTLASQLALNNQVAAIITAPVQKSIINDAIAERLIDITNVALKKNNGYFSGHTEFFQHMADCPDVVMMLANDKLKVALVTTHIPLNQVSSAVTSEKLTTVLDILLDDMNHKFALPQPTIKVCGLNPHAGENGHLGTEEIDTINPVLKQFQQRESGKNLSNCLPADTLFNPNNLQHTDCFLAMYHDQGLTVLKALGFGNTVNITLGLPFIRTSVDHGTALDIAGTGKADANSLKQAIKMAVDLAKTNQPSTLKESKPL